MFTTTDIVYEQIWQHPTEPFAMMDRRWKPSVEIAPNCPRCASANTKFCYYNNYSLSQPRYFCKGCRRYWTKGGSLRNVPVGGGCRKSRRGRSARCGQSQSSATNGFYYKPSGVPNGESLLAEEGNETTEIDLAAVFARFLNQSPSSVEEFESEPHGSSSNFSNSLTPESVENEISDMTVLDCRKKSDPKLSMDYNLPVQEFLPHEKIDDFVETDDGLCTIDHQLQDLVGGNELFQDVLWDESDTAAAACGNFMWQPSSAMQESIPRVQLQEEMEYSLPMSHENDCQSHVHSTMSMLNDNWGSFDLSTFEIFSRPINRISF